MRSSQIGSVEIVEFAKQKLATGVEAQTVGNYPSHLASIFSIALPAWNPLDPQAMEDADEGPEEAGYRYPIEGTGQAPDTERA